MSGADSRASSAPDALPACDLEDRAFRAAEEYLAAIQAGRQPDRAAFLARYADVATALAECLDAVEFVQAAVSSLAGPEEEQREAIPTGGLPEPGAPLG